MEVRSKQVLMGSLVAMSAAAACSRQPTELRVDGLCLDIGVPSIVAEIRDGGGRPAARGATLTIRKPGLEARGYGLDSLLVASGDPFNRAGTFEVRVSKPYYTEAILRNVVVPAGRCGIAESKRVALTISLLPGAPAVRQVVVPHTDYSFGDGRVSALLPAYVLADSGVSTGVTWVSRDTLVATISQDGLLTSACRLSTGRTRVVASAVADPSRRDSVFVEVVPALAETGRCPPRDHQPVGSPI